MLSRFNSAKLVLLQLRRANAQRKFSQPAATPALTEEQLRDICQSKAIDYTKAKELVEAQFWLAKGTANVSDKEISDQLSFHLRNPASTQAFFNSLKLLRKADANVFRIESAVRFTKYS